jgi:hypothetical protein
MHTRRAAHPTPGHREPPTALWGSPARHPVTNAARHGRRRPSGDERMADPFHCSGIDSEPFAKTRTPGLPGVAASRICLSSAGGSPPEQRPVQYAWVTGRGASLEGDQVCAAMERAVTQQPPDGGGVNVVGPRNIGLRLASSEAPHGFLALMRRHLARAAEPNAPLLRSPAALARPRPD